MGCGFSDQVLPLDNRAPASSKQVTDVNMWEPPRVNSIYYRHTKGTRVTKSRRKK